MFYVVLLLPACGYVMSVYARGNEAVKLFTAAVVGRFNRAPALRVLSVAKASRSAVR